MFGIRALTVLDFSLQEMDPFHSLLWETFMPRIRSAVVTWNSRHPDSLIQVLDSWHDLTPTWYVFRFFLYKGGDQSTGLVRVF